LIPAKRNRASFTIGIDYTKLYLASRGKKKVLRNLIPAKRNINDGEKISVEKPINCQQHQKIPLTEE
jgi:hypothetical protein